MWLLIKELVILSISAAIIVGAVRYLLIPGIDQICSKLHGSAKTKGQLIGYATSLPELVVILTSAWAGVFTAGFWNIASSNIINAILFFGAILFFRQIHELKTRHFADEIIFALLSIGLPLVMYGMDMTHSYGTAALLILIFVVYKTLDVFFNRQASPPTRQTDTTTTLHKGFYLLSSGILLVIIGGNYLGDAAEQLVKTLKTPGWMVGGLLGFITSVPEMTSFFEIFRMEKRRGRAAEKHDTQQALDALVASNLCNLGIILPAGILLYLLILH